MILYGNEFQRTTFLLLKLLKYENISLGNLKLKSFKAHCLPLFHWTFQRPKRLLFISKIIYNLSMMMVFLVLTKILWNRLFIVHDISVQLVQSYSNPTTFTHHIWSYSLECKTKTFYLEWLALSETNISAGNWNGWKARTFDRWSRGYYHHERERREEGGGLNMRERA